MFFKILNIFVALNMLLMTCEAAKRQFSMEFYTYTCQAFGKRLKLFDCSYLKVNNEHYMFNQTLKFDRDMDAEYKVRVWIDARPTFAKKSFRFADVKFEACSIFEYKFDLQFLRLVMQEFRKSNNLPQQCPFKANVVYKMNNFSMKTHYIPAYAPACNFTFGLDYYESNNLFGSVKVTGALIV